MRLIISTVSHNHGEMIIDMGSLAKLARMENVIVVCRSNSREANLESYCKDNNIDYIYNKRNKGFSENNNLNYLYYVSKYEYDKDDCFLLLNPDIQIDEESILSLIDFYKKSNASIIAGNLYLDENSAVEDDNIRKFPRLNSFISAYLFNNRKTVIKKSDLSELNTPVWASGALLAVKSSVYKSLEGLDERYYMYCEDIDFCYRAYKAGHVIQFSEDIKAIHWRQRASRKFISRYFIWHMSSALRFCFTKKSTKPKNSTLHNFENIMSS